VADILRPGQGLLFMKVGVHAKESLEDIIQRKQREYDQTGMIFWGYGGNTCHPTKHVQPYAREVLSRGNDVILVMQRITSNHFAEPVRAQQYSDDGFTWQDVPEGINALGSRCALVLEQLELNEFDLDLEQLRVAVGPSRGANASQYLQGRVDKGCFTFDPTLIDPLRSTKRAVSLYAKLKAPYAVHLR